MLFEESLHNIITGVGSFGLSGVGWKDYGFKAITFIRGVSNYAD